MDVVPLGSLLPGEPALIGVDGRAGSGKSTLARRLAALAGGEVVCADDFSHSDPDDLWAPADIGRLRREVIDALLAGREARYRPWDWDRRRLGPVCAIPPGGIVVIEGVRALHPELRDAYVQTIWVDCPREVRLARGIARDGEGMRRQWEAWMAAEDAYVACRRPDLASAVTVDGDPTLPHDTGREVVLLSGTAAPGR